MCDFYKNISFLKNDFNENLYKKKLFYFHGDSGGELCYNDANEESEA